MFVGKALRNGKIYLPDSTLVDHALLIQYDKIVDIVHQDHIPNGYECFDMKGYHISPGFIDLQIYGTGNDLYSADLSSDSLLRIEHNLLKQGCTSFCLTLATNTLELFKEAIHVYQQTKTKAVLGLHLEGPFLNSKKRGAHPEDLILPISIERLEDLFQHATDAVKVMTVAPELLDDACLSYLKAKGILVSAGHSNASFSEAFSMFDKGVSTVTHLWNAMSPLYHREVGLVGAAFNHDTVLASIIVDGIHVDYEAVKLSKMIMKDRLFLITDAVAASQKGIYQHILNKDHYVLPNGTLSGSALTMMQAIANCVNYVDISLDEAIRMATLYPARLLQLDDIGQLAIGSRANITVFDSDYSVHHVLFDGEFIV